MNRAVEGAARRADAPVALMVVVVSVWTGCGASTVAGGVPDGSAAPDASLGDAPSVIDASHPSDAASDASSPEAASAGDGATCTPAGSPPVCPPAAGLECDVNTRCPDGGSTTLSGTVYDPAGLNPVYQAVVYVPRDPATIASISTGRTACGGCDVVATNTVTAAATGADGSFRLTGVPTGDDIPLVIEVGKWRRIVQVPEVTDCEDTQVPADLTRLPRNQTEGDLPQMAVLTGGCDNVACFLRGVGVDAAEFTAPHAGGRVDVYQGLGASGPAAPLSGGTAGDCTTDACPLWSSTTALAAYDAIFLGCECAANDQTKPAASKQALHDWLGLGGQVFATHSQATWFENGPADFQAVANWADGPSSGAVGPFAVDTTTYTGTQFLQWLIDVGAAGSDGFVSLDPANVSTSVTSVASDAFEWIDDTSTAAEGGSPLSGNVKGFSFDTPIADGGPTFHCGRAYFSDVHPGGGQALVDAGASASGVPAACDVGPLTPEEKTLEFYLFAKNAICFADTMPPPLPPCPDGG